MERVTLLLSGMLVTADAIERVRWEDLETRLAEIYLKRAEKVVFVRGDADVDFQYVADVIDVAHHAGVQRVGLLTTDRAVSGE